MGGGMHQGPINIQLYVHYCCHMITIYILLFMLAFHCQIENVFVLWLTLYMTNFIYGYCNYIWPKMTCGFLILENYGSVILFSD